jgi:truncated hemoglobin YjbI
LAESHAVRVEIDLAAQRNRANRLESQLETAEIARGEAEADAAELREAMQKADHDRTTAVAIADEAVRAAEELRRAEAQRAGQGRWARLRAAWRGE